MAKFSLILASAQSTKERRQWRSKHESKEGFRLSRAQWQANPLNIAKLCGLFLHYNSFLPCSVYRGTALKAFDDSPVFRHQLSLNTPLRICSTLWRFSIASPDGALLINFSIICVHISFFRSLARQQRRRRREEREKPSLKRLTDCRYSGTAEKRLQHVYTQLIPLGYLLFDWFWNFLHCCFGRGACGKSLLNIISALLSAALHVSIFHELSFGCCKASICQMEKCSTIFSIDKRKQHG